MDLPPIPGLKFATPLDPDAVTTGPRKSAFARVWLGHGFMPWQQYAADLIGTLNDQGLPKHNLILITGPRQIGKSHLDMADTGEAAFSRPGYRAWYTAQTGMDARDQFLKFADEVVAGSPLESVVTTLRGNGHEVMKFPRGSTLRPHPPTEKSLHGKQSDRNGIDEGWAFTEDDGKQLLQAISPTQLTRPGAQTIIWSAGGTASSTWLAALLSRLRSGDPTIAGMEMGIPDDLELDDLEAIARHHPAYGHTVTLDSIRNLRAQLPDDAEFARAVGNRWTEIIGGAIGAAEWNRVRWADPIPDDAPIGYGAARAADGTHTVLAAAAMLPDGLVVVEIVKVIPVNEAAETIKAWAAGESLVVDPSGPSAALHDELARLEVPVLPFTSRDVGAACTNVLDALGPRLYRYRPHPALDAAVKVAGTRTVGDGGKAWARVAAGAPIAALEAASNAIWSLTHRTPVKAAPRIYFGKDAA